MRNSEYVPKVKGLPWAARSLSRIAPLGAVLSSVEGPAGDGTRCIRLRSWHQKRRALAVPAHAGLQSSRSSGRVTAGIACGSKLKRDGWRVVDLSLRGEDDIIIQFRSFSGR